MSWQALIFFAPMLAILCVAAGVDLRQRRIPNALTLCLAVTGVLQSFSSFGTTSPGGALLGMLCGTGLGVLLFVSGGVGGGDLKLLGSAGAWLGPGMVFQVFLGSAILALLLVLVQCALQRRLGTLMKNSMVVAVNLVHARQLGLAHARATGESCRSTGRPLPYAVPFLMSALLILVSGRTLL